MAPRGIGVVIAAAAAGSDNVSLSFHALFLLPEKLGWNLTDAFLYTGPQYS